MHLDRLDKRILFEYDGNSRRPLSQIARALKISRERLEYRTKRLIESGIILGFGAAVNPNRLGYQLYKVFLRIRQRRSRAERLLAFLVDHPRAAWVTKSEGSWDVIFCLYAVNELEFHQMHMQLFSQFNDIVMSFNSCLMTTIKMYQRGYLTPNKHTLVFPLFGNREPERIDESSRILIRLLAENAWASNQELAERCDLTAKTVATKIADLEQRKIITGYRVNLDMDKLGLLFFKTRIYLESYDERLRRRFERYCDQHPHITCYSEQIGDCNIEIEMHVSRYDEYFAIIEDIRLRFENLVRNYDSLLLGRGVYHWIPRD
jgi:DNA-binding Lrp family transcriptional regulator